MANRLIDMLGIGPSVTVDDPNAPQVTPAGYGFGPPYSPSPEAYSGVPAMVLSQADANMGQGGPDLAPDRFGGGGSQTNPAPYGVAGVPYWRNYMGNASTGGGFFTANDLFGRARQGPPVSAPGSSDIAPDSYYTSRGMRGPVSYMNAPSAGGSGMLDSGAPSTNNWRLLAGQYRQPGFVMRNGRIINVGAQNTGPQVAGGWVPPSDPSQSYYKPFNAAALGAPYGVSLGGFAGSGSVWGWPGDVGGAYGAQGGFQQ